MIKQMEKREQDLEMQKYALQKQAEQLELERLRG